MDNGGMDFTIIVLGDVIQCHNTPMTIAIVGTCNIICKLPKLPVITVKAEKMVSAMVGKEKPMQSRFCILIFLRNTTPYHNLYQGVTL